MISRIGRGFILLTCLAAAAAVAEPLSLHARKRVPDAGDTNRWEVVGQELNWEPTRTAIVICDMWDKHHCPSATERVGEMVPRMNALLQEARKRGVQIIHCPSDTMDFYKETPGRKLAQTAPKVYTAIPLEGWCSLKPDKEAPLPIDDSDGGCDGCPECPSFKAWKSEHPGLEILPGDAITDSAEAYYFMRQRGITNVIVMGVHINMCVLGRPFSIRQMVRQGQNVLLMRDLTDSMYNHLKRPYVNHFRGTELVVEHIEKYWCGSIASTDLLGGQPFRFKEDKPKNVVFLIGEDEYDTKNTLPAFGKSELDWRGYRATYVQEAPGKTNGFIGIDALKTADLLVISVRRRLVPSDQMAVIRDYIASGRPIVGIRTATHAFEIRDGANPPDRSWVNFDHEILGADYEDHYGAGMATLVSAIPEAATNAILNNINPTFRVTSHLYRSRHLTEGTTPLLSGKTEDGKSMVEPVAWINTANQRRVFYTSMGSAADFAQPDFRRLLLNGIIWAVGDSVPPREASSSAKPKTADKAANDTPAKSPEQTGPLSPEESLARMHVPNDLALDQVLAEPDIAQPVALNFDERGRLWVVEYRQYPSPAGINMVSHDHFWRAVYDKMPPPPPNHFRGKDRITIHEDADGDGVFEKHTTFVDGLNICTSVAFGRGGVYVLNPPYLLFYPDRNHDDVPDGDPSVLLSGFGLEDTHSVANSLSWGPDGWLYGCQGSTVTGNILVYGPDGKPTGAPPVASQGQNIWRYHPERRIYEVFSEGGGNAFGLEMDSAGRIFSGHNGGDTRGFHYMQGAYLQKGFDKHGPLSNPFAFGYFPPMGHPAVQRFTHTFTIYEADALPEYYRGNLFGVEPLQGRVVMAEIEPVGSTFKTKDLGYVITSDDTWFKPVDIKLGPDGALYIADWYDRQVNHFRNHEGQIDTSNGRVYRLRSKTAPAGALARTRNLFTPKPGGSDADLPWTKLLSNPNRTVRRTALRLIADRQPNKTDVQQGLFGPGAKTNNFSPGVDASLEYFWAVYLVHALGPDGTIAAWNHPDPQIRLWAVRLAGDDPSFGISPLSRSTSEVLESVLELPAELAKREPNLEVRAQLACTARKLDSRYGLAIARALAAHNEDAADPRQPLLIWWAMETHFRANPKATLDLFEDRDFWQYPIVRDHLLERMARRLAATATQAELLQLAHLFDIAPDTVSAKRLMAGLDEALQGRPLPHFPPALTASLQKSAVESDWLRCRRGDPEALAKARTIISSPSAKASERIRWLQVLAETRDAASTEPILKIATSGSDESLQLAALAALGGFDDLRIPAGLCGALPAMGAGPRAAALSILASRTRYASIAVDRVKQKTLEPAVFGDDAVRHLLAVADAPTRAAINELWPSVSTAHGGSDFEPQIRRVIGAAQSTGGDPYHGFRLFMNNCGVCHRLFGRGAEIGPDLTPYQRTDISTLALNIVNPNAEIREGYEPFQLETKDGRTLTGFLVQRDAEAVVLRCLDGQNTSVAQKEIVEIKPAGRSLMPEGLLDSMPEGDLKDLFAYLRSSQPLPDAK